MSNINSKHKDRVFCRLFGSADNRENLLSLYDAYSAGVNLNRHGKKLEKIPTPKYFVLYNGLEDAPDKMILTKNKAEVTGMFLEEYNEAETMEMFKEEGRAEGIISGINEARLDNAKRMLADSLPIEKIALYTGLSADEVLELKASVASESY